MQFRVPQNIALEDRIVGPLTAIQFGIVVIGGGIAFLVFSSGTLPYPLNMGAGVMLAFLTVVIALGKFNDQPMYRFVRHIAYFFVRPKVRVWHKSGSEVKLIKRSPKKAKEQSGHQAKHVSKKDIAQLALLIDSRGRQGAAPNLKNQQTPKP